MSRNIRPSRENMRGGARSKVSPAFRQKVQKIISRNLEKKFTVNIANLVGVSNTYAATYELNDPDQGDGQNDRNGNQIKVTGFYGQWIVQQAHTPVSSPYKPLVRVVMYIPKDPDDSTPISAIGSEIDTDLYTVLHDQMFEVSNITHGPQKITFKKSFTRGGKVGMNTQFNGAAGTTVTKNPIRLLFYSDQSLSSEYPLLTGHMKCWFTDA